MRFSWGGKIVKHLVLSLALLALAGCAGPGVMTKSDQPLTAKPDQALVVFMRSTFVGSAISASVFDVSGKDNKLIGIVGNGTKVGYLVPPGEHTFMVVSEAADFMKANVAAGKTYYAMVTPRMGLWKARFSLRPLRAAELTGPEFASWDADTSWVENSPQSLAWAGQNGADIAQKRTAYWAEWSAKPAEQQASQTLNVNDGR
jgi:hypothetical protein